MKLLLRLFILAIFVVLLVACGNTTSDKNNEKDESSKEQAVEESNEQEEKESNQDINEPEVSEEEEQDNGGKAEEPDNEVLLKNDAFQIFEPAPDAVVKDYIVVRGLARVFEGTVQYEFEDGHYILDKGFTTASAGGPEWGEFEIVIDLDVALEGAHRIVLFEESAKDGSVINELIIPVQVSK